MTIGQARLPLAGAGVFVLALALYAPTIGYGFTGWDDTAYVLNNPQVTSAAEFSSIWTSPDAPQYYPLTFASYWLEYRLWGPHPAGYHATNVVLHALNSVLVLLVVRALGVGLPGATLASALFAAHPIQAMSVAWVAERKNLLACLFTLLALLAWMHPERERAGRGRLHALALLAFVAALLSKTAVLCLPATLALYDWLLRGRRMRESLPRLIPMVAASVAAALVTRAFEEKFVDDTASHLIPDLAERLQIAGAAIWFYLGKLLLPVHLAPAYPPWSVGRERIGWWLPLVVTVAVAVAFVWLLPRARKSAAACPAWGAAFFVILLGPSLGLIPFGNLALTFVSDHFLYVPAVGLFAVAGSTFERLLARRRRPARRVAWAFAGGIVVLLAARTLAYAPVFRSVESMWSRVVEVDPGSYAGNLGVAEALLSLGRVAEAMPRYETAIARRPGAVDAHLLLGRARKSLGDQAGAERAFRRALELSPRSVAAMVGLASVLGRQETAPEALALFERAVRVAPRDVPARMGLGGTLLGFDKPAKALEQFEAVVDLRPEYPRGYLGAATCLRALSRYPDAVTMLRAGVARSPDDPTLLNLLALTLATAPRDDVRDGAEALALAERASEGAGQERHELLDTLAAAYAEAGRFEDAVRASERAEALATRADDEPSAAESRRRSGLYRARKAVRLGR